VRFVSEPEHALDAPMRGRLAGGKPCVSQRYAGRLLEDLRIRIPDVRALSYKSAMGIVDPSMT
jgi:hypothetical protein